MNIIVDVREHSLIEKLQGLTITNPNSHELRSPEFPRTPSAARPEYFTNVKITTEQLLIGDILLRTDAKKEILLFERKSLPDLLASIKDGRYKEQSHRLTHTSGLNPHNVVYIIEGVLSTLRPSDKKIVLSAIASLSYFKGFSVFRTASVFDTAEIVLAMATKIQKEMEGGSKIPLYCSVVSELAPSSSQTPVLETQEDGVEKTFVSEEHVSYSAFVKKAKKDNITPENIGEILLCQIPGISSTIATEVLKHFDNSFSRLIEEIKTCPEKLDTIYLESAGGKKRKLSSSVIAAIKTFLTR